MASGVYTTVGDWREILRSCSSLKEKRHLKPFSTHSHLKFITMDVIGRLPKMATENQVTIVFTDWYKKLDGAILSSRTTTWHVCLPFSIIRSWRTGSPPSLLRTMVHSMNARISIRYICFRGCNTSRLFHITLNLKAKQNTLTIPSLPAYIITLLSNKEAGIYSSATHVRLQCTGTPQLILVHFANHPDAPQSSHCGYYWFFRTTNIPYIQNAAQTRQVIESHLTVLQ